MTNGRRLLAALFSIDKTLHPGKHKGDAFVRRIYSKKKQILSISDAMERQVTTIDIRNAEGHVSGEYVYLYPPGIPIIVPGEEIDGEFVRDLKRLKERGLALEGMKDFTASSIGILAGF